MARMKVIAFRKSFLREYFVRAAVQDEAIVSLLRDEEARAMIEAIAAPEDCLQVPIC